MGKQGGVILIVILSIYVCVAAVKEFAGYPYSVPIPATKQRTGNADSGYQYVITGDYIKSGIGYSYYKLLNGKDVQNLLNRSGKNARVPYNFTVIRTPQNTEAVVPNCLQCHAQKFDGKLVVGLGNSFMNFSNISSGEDAAGKVAKRIMQTLSPRQYEAAKPMIRSFSAVYPLLKTEVQGVNAADRLAMLLVAHRDPVSLKWQDESLLDIPDEVIPTDVPAWWLLKKKHAMFYTGFGRGDFGQFLMLSNLLTVKDTLEARETLSHSGDVLAYINSIQAPEYPFSIDIGLATKGKTIFAKNCSSCHGSYGKDEYYPNLLIPAKIIKTDSLLFSSNYQNPQFIEWFNKSWYSKGNNPARLQPYKGYIAPPLDGVWITAPYLHNGSVPNLETLLNSSARPRYWKRDFNKPEYDYDNVGWKYETTEQPAKNVYNTDLPGYGNSGHTFGDYLSSAERKALIEYLKTL